MSESKVFSLSKKADQPDEKESVREQEENDKPSKPAGKSKGAKRACNAKAKAKCVSAKATKASTVMMTESDSYLDDVMNSIEFVLQGVQEKNRNEKRISEVWGYAFEFGMKGRVEVHDGTELNTFTEFRSWSKLHKHLKTLLLEWHPGQLVEDPDLWIDKTQTVAPGVASRAEAHDLHSGSNTLRSQRSWTL
jgi:hypothetical protein